MSGEYFSLEEVDPNTYLDEYYQENDSSPVPADNLNFVQNADVDTKSNTSKRSRDTRLYEIEEQLELAENRCNTLKGQLDSMKKMYQKSGSNDLQFNNSHITGNKKSIPLEQIFTRKISKRTPRSPRVVSTPFGHVGTPIRKQKSLAIKVNDGMHQNSSDSSTTVRKRNVHIVHHRSGPPLVRQSPTKVITEYSDGPATTINKMLTGITTNMNKGAQEDKSKFSTISEIPCQFSPRVEERVQAQQRKIEELLKMQQKSNERIRMSTTSVKSKKPSKLFRSNQSQSKTQTHKTKMQISSGSLNIARPIKSMAKHVENTTKLRPVRNGMVDEDSQSVIMSRKRKRNVKRLNNPTKRYDVDQDSPYEHGTSTNLIELYHNSRVKASDSEESHRMSKTQVRQKGGGDLPMKSLPEICSVEEVQIHKPANQFNNSRMLTTINEHTYRNQDQYGNRSEYLNSDMVKRYAQPTISSKLKKVAKSYLRRFNAKQIPFCVAKSITPSHNIGVNIQQVMSIMKTRQPIMGISPTLAHNIALVAGKLQSNPLAALVSTLSSKMAYRQSHCPLVHTELDYNHLQEIAKIIENEPYEQRPGFAGDGGSESVINKPFALNGFNEMEMKGEEKPVSWTIDPSEEKCTCASQNGVPFDQVLNSFKMSSGYNSKPNDVVKVSVSRARNNKPPYPTAVQRRATKSSVTNTNITRTLSKSASLTPVGKGEGGDLHGKEKNLKTVLKNLYDEFDSLNNKYDVLSKEVNLNKTESTSETMIKELENLETVLNKKEEEINMVMSLYTEVVALKDQVKKLREKSSQSAVSAINNSTNKEPATATHLTHLLRQIQNYQSQWMPSSKM